MEYCVSIREYSRHFCADWRRRVDLRHSGLCEAAVSENQNYRRRAGRFGCDVSFVAKRPPGQIGASGFICGCVAVRHVGKETFRLCRELVDEVILVDTDAICAAVKDVFEDTRTILEPSGALSVAGIKAYVAREKILHKTLVAIASGANMNFDRLRHISERAEIGERREAVLTVTIPEKPGSFKKFCNLLGAKSITEFNYRYADPKVAHVFVGVSVRNQEETRS